MGIVRLFSVPVVSYRTTAFVFALFVVVSTTVVGAQTTGPVSYPEAADFAVDGEAIEAVLAEVGLDAAWRSVADLHPGARLRTVDYRGSEGDPVADLMRAAFELAATTAQRDKVVGQLRRAAVTLDRARTLERDREIARNQADVYYRGIHALTQAVAIDVFAGPDPSTEAILGLDGEALTVAQREFKLTNTTLDEMIELRHLAEDDLAAAISLLGAATARRIALEAMHAGLVEDAAALAATRRTLDDSARAMVPAATAAFALASVPGQPGLTPRALDAYLNAERAMTALAPNCHVSWRTIAAVASVEGLHGEYGNRRLDIDGRADRPIIGIALDGSTVDNFGDTTANLADTDNGLYDGDPLHDRAVGPLQFIPDTWSRWRRDGDGDGETDPQDIDDAALSAAAYLCAYGSLRDWTGWSTAIFGYNHSAAYVNSVKSSLDRVQTLSLPEFEGDDELRQRSPFGTWVPIPVPPPEEENPEGEPPATTTPGPPPPTTPPAAAEEPVNPAAE